MEWPVSPNFIYEEGLLTFQFFDGFSSSTGTLLGGHDDLVAGIHCFSVYLEA